MKEKIKFYFTSLDTGMVGEAKEMTPKEAEEKNKFSEESRGKWLVMGDVIKIWRDQEDF